MRNRKRSALIGGCALAWLLAGAPQAAAQPDCAGDNANHVCGNQIRMAISTFRAAAGPRPVLAVFLHGNVGSERTPVRADTIREADSLARMTRGVVSVALLRPGFRDTRGRRSDGPFLPQLQADSPDIAAVADAIATLRRHHNASRLVLFGYSGGARLIGRMMQRGLAGLDAALLYACPCEDPAEALATPPDTFRVQARGLTVRSLVGADDRGVSGGPALVASLRAQGADARHAIIPDQGHALDDIVWQRALAPVMLELADAPRR